MSQIINIDQTVLESMNSSFPKHDHHLRKSTPCRIRFNGRFITTLSGKTLWRTVGHAKTALLHHFETVASRDKYKPNKTLGFLPVTQYGYIDGNTMKGFIRQLEAEGHIEYVAVDNEGLPISN
jgi:hypothetical protein